MFVHSLQTLQLVHTGCGLLLLQTARLAGRGEGEEGETRGKVEGGKRGKWGEEDGRTGGKDGAGRREKMKKAMGVGEEKCM